MFRPPPLSSLSLSLSLSARSPPSRRSSTAALALCCAISAHFRPLAKFVFIFSVYCYNAAALSLFIGRPTANIRAGANVRAAGVASCALGSRARGAADAIDKNGSEAARDSAGDNRIAARTRATRPLH